LCVLKPILDQ